MSRRYPANPIVGVGVVVWKDGKVLLVRRARPPREGEWSLPGGRQRIGETVRETAVREVREETGVDIEIAVLLDVVDAIVERREEGGDGGSGPEYHYTLIDFDADWRAGEARPDGDAAAVAWVDPAEIASYVHWQETVRIVGLSAEWRGLD